VKTKLAALGLIADGWSRSPVQGVLASIHAGDEKFPLGVGLGEGPSGDESPHSKVCLAPFSLECSEFSELWSEERPTVNWNGSVKTKLAALGLIADGWSRSPVQDDLASIRAGDVKFPLGVG
jgi:hypothetical protein